MSIHAFIPRELPPALRPLTDLALDLRWTWSRRSNRLWRTIDPETWEATRNPWIILQNTPGPRFRELSRDADFRRELEAILEERRSYGSGTSRPQPAGSTLRKPVAYFSMEFGLGEGVPLYAGGLGVLAGDHLKTASDLGVPIVGVGLLYQEGYFRQMVGADGRQEALYPYNDPTALPIQPELASSGAWLTIPLELPGRVMSLRVWRANVGRVVLYLLDSNAPANDPADRGITGKLYGDGPETRMRQELVLGIGGWRLLDTLGIDVGACHLNEGHTAFAVLERARTAMRRHGLAFQEALWATRAGNVFTTHTPVEAGFDSFSPSLLARFFPPGEGYLAELGISLHDLLALGRAHAGESTEPFRPAFLAMRGSARVNAVSALHAETSRRLFGSLFPRWPTDEVPIRHVTNGVHVPSWLSRPADEMWTATCGADPWRGRATTLGAAMCCIDDRALWVARGRAREDLVRRVLRRVARQLARRGARRELVAAAAHTLDPDVLTLGFARRFATYKRPNLLLRDPDRLRRLFDDPHRPIQLVVAGKAHPDDRPGKELVESWVRFAGRPEVRARCVFLEDYDLALAQELVQGVDVWINTPRRPWEACGTSGMKVLANGGLNLSALDGWWAEAYTPDVGWSMPGGDGPSGEEADDARDAEVLFQLLEREVVPGFYDRDAEGLPRAWLARVRASLSQLTPRFSANRMLDEYLDGYYRPAEEALAERTADGCAKARELGAWAQRLVEAWPALRLGRVEMRPVGDGGNEITVEVFEDVLQAGDLSVELYAEGDHGAAARRVPMTTVGPLPGTSHGLLFGATVPGDRPASDYTPRIVPTSARAALPMELPLVAWHH
jgi:starch phosphorylase